MLGLVRALAEGNAEAALGAVRTAARSGVDMPLFLTLALEAMRSALLLRHAPELTQEILEEAGEDQGRELLEVAGMEGSKLSHDTLRTFLDAAARIRFAPIPELPLELAVLELA